MKLLEIKQKDKYLLEDSIITYGVEAQCDMLVEECAELIQALQKLKRAKGKTKEEKYKDLQDELADVFLMSNEIAYIFGITEVQERINFKLNRLKNRLKEDEIKR